MIEVDFLKISDELSKSGVRGRILPLVRKAAKNIAAGEPFRMVNLPGSVIEINGGKSVVTKQGRLCRIA